MDSLLIRRLSTAAAFSFIPLSTIDLQIVGNFIGIIHAGPIHYIGKLKVYEL
jgi:hypothetical protein